MQPLYHRVAGTLRRYSEHVECLAACMASKATEGRVALRLQALNELCAGKLDSLTYAQMRELHPEQYTARMDDKLNYRYPGVGGESCTPHRAPTLDSQAGSHGSSNRI